ncbi:hypothetical protein E2562_027611 [Oryza meyeriana var. granulata]|uniref:BHLH domain-containing protein n=1 Tax=Oryza meyeriana var. granulata TaxID=110450 RepID=A0A6G1DMY7_9ORYZ|nr:hypothetical protein E2562_027611 [Oryza meyeriana var. granulata]
MDHQLEARDLFSPTTLPLLLFVAGLAVLYALRRWSSGLRLPPSPFGLPILGHLHLLAPLPHQALHRLAERHGPLLYLRLGSVPCVAACSPDAAREVLKTHETAFLDRPKPAAVHRLTYGGQDFSFSAYGPYWRFMKRACVHELLAGRTLDRLRHVRREEVARLVGSLRSSAADGAPVDVDAALMGLTGDIVSRMVMSRRWTGDDNDTEEMRSVVAETAELTGTFNLQDYIGAFRYWDVQGLRKRIDAVHRKLKYVYFQCVRATARREKINARMELLKELVPGCSKVSGTALVLDEIINHVQSLQRQVEEKCSDTSAIRVSHICRVLDTEKAV